MFISIPSSLPQDPAASFRDILQHVRYVRIFGATPKIKCYLAQPEEVKLLLLSQPVGTLFQTIG